MNDHGVNTNSFFHIHDIGLTRCRDLGRARQSLVGSGMAALQGMASDASDRAAAASRDASPTWQLLRDALTSFVADWRAAARRRGAVQQMKRIDRRMLRDLGLERAGIRELVDDLAIRRASTTGRAGERDAHLRAAYDMVAIHFRTGSRA
jgi:uncharacterized protein YjiS (DUF1127 family)